MAGMRQALQQGLRREAGAGEAGKRSPGGQSPGTTFPAWVSSLESRRAGSRMSNQGLPSRLTAAVATALSSELAAISWGAPPCVYSIWARGNECELRAVALPPEAWQAGPPSLVVAMMASAAAALAASPEYRAPDGLHGVAVRGQSGRPGDTEFGIMLAFDREGHEYTVVRSLASGRSMATVDAAGAGAEGTLQSALRLLVSELTRTAEQEPETQP